VSLAGWFAFARRGRSLGQRFDSGTGLGRLGRSASFSPHSAARLDERLGTDGTLSAGTPVRLRAVPCTGTAAGAPIERVGAFRLAGAQWSTAVAVLNEPEAAAGIATAGPPGAPGGASTGAGGIAPASACAAAAAQATKPPVAAGKLPGRGRRPDPPAGLGQQGSGDRSDESPPRPHCHESGPVRAKRRSYRFRSRPQLSVSRVPSSPKR